MDIFGWVLATLLPLVTLPEPPPVPPVFFTILGPPDNPVTDVFGACGIPCYVRYNIGGEPEKFVEAAEYAKKNGLYTRISGKCYSGCILFADLARPNVCIEADAEFFFHAWWWRQEITTSTTNNRPYPWNGKVRGADATVYYDPVQSPDIMKWLNDNGPAPIYGWLPMSYLEGLQFWPKCDPPR
ncbi:MAG: hypothetical protein KBD50_04060 [Candidatus Pacebacteria bacterium]|nr:hypothetical protein [Candidatus Paceibacterota bacterium]